MNTDFLENKLEKDDILKIGRFIFKVSQIHTSKSKKKTDRAGFITDFDEVSKAPQNLEDMSLDSSTEIHKFLYKSNLILNRKKDSMILDMSLRKDEDEYIWRICLGESDTLEDPFISPWSCSGTMKYIHFNWIKSWLNSKKVVKQGVYFYSIIWQVVTCELCKQNFNDTVCYKGKMINLLDYDLEIESKNWLVFEALDTEFLFDQKVKLVHIFDFKDLDILSLGRGHASNAKLTDISISRLHAYLKVIDDDIWIEDAESKFGCLYLQKTPFKLKLDSEKLSIQVGRTYLSVSVKKKSKSNWWRWLLNSNSIFDGKHFEKCLEDFPIELQNLYYDRESRLNNALEEGLRDDQQFNSINDKFMSSFWLSRVGGNEYQMSVNNGQKPTRLSSLNKQILPSTNQNVNRTIEMWEEEVKGRSDSLSPNRFMRRRSQRPSNLENANPENLVSEDDLNMMSPWVGENNRNNLELYAKLREDRAEAIDFSI